MPVPNSMPEYSVESTTEGVLFTDSEGRQVVFVKNRGPATTYAILDSNNNEVGFMTGWSAPSLAISGMPLYSSSTMIKISERDGGEEVQRITVSAQSISSTKMNVILLDRKENILSFVAETSVPGAYEVKNTHGMQFASLSRLGSKTSYKLKMTGSNPTPEIDTFKLVAGTVLFNSLQSA